MSLEGVPTLMALWTIYVRLLVIPDNPSSHTCVPCTTCKNWLPSMRAGTSWGVGEGQASADERATDKVFEQRSGASVIDLAASMVRSGMS